MELRAKAEYHNAFCSLFEGTTTEGIEIPEEVKVQMLEDHPDWFESFEGTITTPEDGLQVTTQEAKLPKTRNK